MLTPREALASISAIAGHVLFPGVLDASARAQARPTSPSEAWQPELLSPALGEVLATTWVLHGTRRNRS
jgi:hypothetical protein